ncbi:MAG TPA: adenylate/guanylate cyclase domain-containing protein [Methylomirabilota bacterium]|nr:adenylate/guanylate cyclase domain-containing protein [Methylomirabilota bacterium]
MNCPACAQDLRPGARFCDGCGAAVEARCPACGKSQRPHARFCDACGTPLAAGTSAAPTAAPAPVAYTPRHLAERILTEGRALRGERKEVTVLFVDVQGSTELAGALDPEEFHAVMDGAFQIMLDAVHRWEGTVNQFTGDGIMALFGAPIAHEDHARRASHAALEIQRGFGEHAARLRRDKGFSIQVRLGLNSGPVIVGAIGDDLRMDYTAQGLTTNLAARMQQAAEPGSILMAAPTHQLVEGYFRLRPLGALNLRGATEPVDAFVLDGEGSVVSRLQASLRRGVSPFRGREAELALLGEAWERAAAGRGDAICLVGEPGIGKSRLAYELQRHLGLPDRIEGAAQAYARGAAYFAFRPLLRQLAALAPDEDLAAAREGLHRRLWDLSPELAAFVPDVLPILGTSCETLAMLRDAPADGRRDRVQDAVVAWVAAECRRAPRLVLIEDVHWLDPSSEDLCRRLATAARELPLLLLMTSRLPLTGSGLEVAGVREVRLRSLAAEDIEALVNAQLDPYPARENLRRAVAERAQGNPFYVEELVRAFRERGDLVLGDGAYDLSEAAAAVVPPSLHALIAARIDRLPPSARELIADAAVLGKRFLLAHLNALTPGERFDEDLALLERRGLLDRESGGGIAGLSFHHVLIQEVAYGALLQADRKTRHRRAAETIESLYRGRTEEVCDQLAHHWARSDRAVAALPYLMTAADGAVAMGANQEAISHLQGALELTTAHPDAVGAQQRDALRLKLAGLHFVVGER